MVLEPRQDVSRVQLIEVDSRRPLAPVCDSRRLTSTSTPPQETPGDSWRPPRPRTRLTSTPCFSHIKATSQS